MKLIRKPNGYYDLLIKGELKSIEQFNITKEDCDILTLGYSVEKMADDWFYNEENKNLYENYNEKPAWIKGFKAHQELTKDKLFTLQDVINIIEEAQTTDESMNYPSIEEIIKGFMPKTEWDCYISDGKLVLL